MKTHHTRSGLDAHLEPNALRSQIRGLYIAALLLACAVLFLLWQGHQLAGEIAARPPLAVLDVNSHVLRAVSDDPATSAEAATASAWERAATLAEQGYIVIRKDSIVAMPEGYEVP